MSAFSAVGVDNNFAACKTRIAVRATNDKLARGVYKIFYLVVEERQHLLAVYLLFYARHQNVDNVLTNTGQHLVVVVHKLVVLGAHHDGVDTFGHTAITILHGNLAL